MPRMRILHIGSTDRADTNGVHRATHTLATMSARGGADVTVLNLSRSAEIQKEWTEGSFRRITIPVDSPPVGGSHLQFLRAPMRRRLKDIAGEADVVHLHSVFQPDHVWATRTGRPYVLTPHGGYSTGVLSGGRALSKRLWFALSDRRLLSQAALVHVLSESEADRVVELQPYARTAVLPIPLADDRAAGGWKGEAGPIVFLGRLNIRHKGLDLLMEGFASSAAVSSGVRLVIAGPSDSGSLDWLRERAVALGISGLVDFPGAVRGDAKIDLLRTAGWFVHSSRWEGVPLSVLEAASLGVPLLVTEQTNLGDRVRAHSAGFVSDATTTGVAHLLDQAASLSSLGKAAMSSGALSLSQDFSTSHLAGSYVNMYNEALS